MASYSDNLNIIISAQVQSAVMAIGSVKSSLDSLNKMYSRVQGIMASANASRSMGKELEKVGISATNTNGILRLYDNINKQSISRTDALSRVTQNLNEQVVANQKATAIKAAQEAETARVTKIYNGQLDSNYNSIMKTGNILPRTTARFKTLDEVMGKTGKSARGNMMKFMGLGFGLMFIGMAIKKATSAALNAISETYKTATGEQSEFNQGMNKLSAAFEFFKFSLMDAIASSEIFGYLLDTVVQILNWFAKLPATVRVMIMIGLAALFIAGSIASIAGQFVLLNASVGTASRFFTIMGGLMGSVIVLILALIAIWYIWNSDLTLTTKVLLTLAVILAAVIGVFTVFGKATVIIKAIGAAFTWLGKNPIVALLLILVLLGLAIWDLVKVADEMAYSVGDVFAALGLALLTMMAVVADAILILLTPVIALLNGIIISMNLISGTKIPTIPYGWDFPLTKSIWESSKRIMAEKYQRNHYGESPGSVSTDTSSYFNYGPMPTSSYGDFNAQAGGYVTSAQEEASQIDVYEGLLQSSQDNTSYLDQIALDSQAQVLKLDEFRTQSEANDREAIEELQGIKEEQINLNNIMQIFVNSLQSGGLPSMSSFEEYLEAWFASTNGSTTS